MNIANWDELSSPHEQACARLALIARGDTINGGARALVLAKRSRLKSFPAEQIVGDIYSASTGKHSKEWEPWQCDECGQAHLGQHAAFVCCKEEDEDYDTF